MILARLASYCYTPPYHQECLVAAPDTAKSVLLPAMRRLDRVEDKLLGGAAEDGFDGGATSVAADADEVVDEVDDTVGDGVANVIDVTVTGESRIVFWDHDTRWIPK